MFWSDFAYNYIQWNPILNKQDIFLVYLPYHSTFLISFLDQLFVFKNCPFPPINVFSFQLPKCFLTSQDKPSPPLQATISPSLQKEP